MHLYNTVPLYKCRAMVLHSAGTPYSIVIALARERVVHITALHNAVSLPLYITVGCVDWCVGGYININSEREERTAIM